MVTGAGSGIGRKTVELAFNYGANVVAVDLNDSVSDTVALLSDKKNRSKAVVADISNEGEVATFINDCIKSFGRVDGIYANAGVPGAGKPVLELTVDDWNRTLSINTIGVFLAVKHSAPHFIAQGQGSIVCTASVAGMRANAGGVDSVSYTHLRAHET